MSARDDFLSFLIFAVAEKSAALQKEWLEKSMAGDTEGAAKAAADRATILAIEGKVDTDDRAALIALWPVPILGDLPEWFVDPVAASAADPPGPAHVVDVGEPPMPEPLKDADGNPVIAEKNLAQIAIENRLARKDADDQARAAWLADQASKRNASQLRLNLVNEKRTAKGWAALDMAYWESIGEDQDVALRFA